jgi:DNA-binding LacI/PurR family transcriptional regulator/signal transduction histidine kinase/ActR/RegA family two-component response regulator
MDPKSETRSVGGVRARRTIGVLISYMELFGVVGYEGQVRTALDRVCRARDLSLLFVYGRALGEKQAISSGHNAIYRLMHPDCVDGLIVLSAMLGTFTGAEEVARLCQGLGSLPMVSLGVALPGTPSVVTDNRAGMEALVEHLVHDHGCRRLAYIDGPPGNPDARIRFEAFQSVLHRHGVPLDPERVASGHFVRSKGEAAADEILGRGLELDGIVAANDGMALGVLEALRKRDIDVPREMVVTGFDDLDLARLGFPPLTTVAQPLEAMLELAVGLVVDQLDGRTVPLVSELPAEFVARQSCGCGRKAASFRVLPGTTADRAELVRQSAPEILRELSAEKWLARAGASGAVSRLLSALELELSGRRGSFLSAVQRIVREAGFDNEPFQDLQLLLTRLREILGVVFTAELEDLWNEARATVALVNTGSQAQQRARTDEACQQVVSAGERCSLALDIPSLKQALADSLPRVGIKTAFVSYYPEEAADELEPLFCMYEGRPYEVSGARFPVRQLLPPGAYPADRRHTSLLFPLPFETQLMGVMLFEHSPGQVGYPMLRDQISLALKSVLLHQEIVNQTMQRERSVQERIATAKRMQALSVLAGGVAHDLNNALGPLVALPDVILGELGEIDPDQVPSVADLRFDVESIKTAALRATQTVKDLLTLGRQGRTTKEPLDLNSAVSACLASEPLRFMHEAGHDVKILLNLHPTPLHVQASEAHLVRALGNLVRNAVEAIEGPGEVVIKTESVSLLEPVSGFETMEPGDYAVVSVADTGPGIPKTALGRIFEPFYTSKRAGENTGSGLGLAIVHSVVKEHEGFVDVESSVGKGSRFILYFPRGVEMPALHTKAPAISHVQARILVVDDEPVQLRTAHRVLTHLGYHVDTLQSGQQAYDMFAQTEQVLRSQTGPRPIRNSPYDLIILDMLLNEDHDGLDIFERIQQLFPKQKVIIASGHAPSERAALAVDRGLAWLVKPYTTESLARAVEAALAELPSLTVVKLSSRSPADPPSRTRAR